MEQELFNLKEWFALEYAYKEQKFRRLVALGKNDDDGISAATKLNDLYQVAEQKRAEIQALELLLKK